MNDEIAIVLQAVSKSNDLDYVMRTIVSYISKKTDLGECTAAILDDNSHVFIPKWSSLQEMRPEWVIRYHKNHEDVPNAPSVALSNKKMLLAQRAEPNEFTIPQMKGIVDIETMLIAPIVYNGESLGTIICHSERPKYYSNSQLQLFEQIMEVVTPVIYHTHQFKVVQKRATILEVLLDTVREFHSSIDVNVVLKELMDNIHSYFPTLESNLWLTLDDFNTSLPVKSLNLLEMNNSLILKAFQDGKLELLQEEIGQSGERRLEIAAPIIGNQGIYGILQLTGEVKARMDESETKFIRTLAETAGIAFENARLYQQSTNHIKQLRLTHDITKKLNRTLKRQEIMDLVASELIQTFSAQYCVVFEPNEKELKLEVKAANRPELVKKTFSLDAGFAGYVYETKEAIIVSDVEKDNLGRKITSLIPCRSLLVAPVLIDDEVVAIIAVADPKSNRFTFEHYQLLETIAEHSSLALRNAYLHEEVERMATMDQLTELYKRHMLNNIIQQSQQEDRNGSLILIDIDHFKDVNDTYGHQVGDETLKQVSHIIRSNVREHDLAARWGGEELAIYLPRTNISIAGNVADRIRECVYQSTNPTITISCGISYWDQEQEKISVESLFHRADKALYSAKDAGRNCVLYE